jgi:3-oxo-5-alpha-steroid 4-dehydrogenase 1
MTPPWPPASLADLHTLAVWAELALAAVTVAATLLVTAPYGRHRRDGWGPTLPTRLAWTVMESPSSWLFLILVASWSVAASPATAVLSAMFAYHYVYRAFVYPRQARVRPGDRTPVLIAALAFGFNVLNSVVNAGVVAGLQAPWPDGWLADPRFIVGASLFAVGHATNRWADGVLRGLRAPRPDGTTPDYAVPRGGLYELVSCPNYLGELVQWTGWAVATWSLGGLAFAIYTAANLVPRALSHHRWYRETFPDYPPARRAVLPWVL